VHSKYKTPHVAIIFFAIVIAVFALTGTFKYLAVVATGSLLLIHTVSVNSSAYTAVGNTGQISHVGLECCQVVDGKFIEVAMPGSARQYSH